MNIKSKRFVFALLFGLIVSLLITILVRPACSGFLIGVVVTAFMAGVSSPRDGAIIGVLVAIPTEIYVFMQTYQQTSLDNIFIILGVISGVDLLLIIFSGLGVFYGMIVGKLIQHIKSKLIIS